MEGKPGTRFEGQATCLVPERPLPSKCKGDQVELHRDDCPEMYGKASTPERLRRLSRNADPRQQHSKHGCGLRMLSCYTANPGSAQVCQEDSRNQGILPF